MTRATIEAELERMKDDMTIERDGFTFTLRELHEAFERVHDPVNWKLPVDAVIVTDPETSEREVAAVRAAVAWFTGSEADVRHRGNYQFSVRAAGYYAAVGA